MSDRDGATSQADADATSQADTTDAQSQRTTEPSKIEDLPDWAQKLIRETRKEAADHRTKLQKIEDANKTELQRALDRAAELEKQYGEVLTQVQQERAERLVLAAAGKANAIRPDAVYRLVKDALAFEDGKPTNVAEAIAQARKEYPELFRAAAGSGDGGKGGDAPRDKNQAVNDFIRQAAAR